MASFVCSLLCLLLLCSCTQAEPRPNILLFLIDDLRYDAFSHMDHPFFESPNIDRLAEEGTRFADAFVVTSVCSPSRATILTGLYPHENGVASIWDDIDLSMPNVPAALQKAGYSTAWIGKWHLSRNDLRPPIFDHWVGFRSHGSYAHPTLNVDGNRYTAEDRHLTDVLTDHAVSYLRGHDGQKPFFLTLSHKAVHAPYLAQRRFHGKFDNVRVEPPESASEDGALKPKYLECRRATDDFEDSVRGYYELATGVDESVGRVMEALEESGHLDDTLVIFMSDNGYMLGEHGLADKRSAYEESIRIPLIVRYPKRYPEGEVVENSMALNLDIGITMLDAAGVPALDGMHGIPLLEQASGARTREDFLYIYYRENSQDNPRSECTPSLVSVRTWNDKLILYPRDDEIAEYYRLEVDPHEMDNKLLDPSARERVQFLKRRIKELSDEVGSTLYRSRR